MSAISIPVLISSRALAQWHLWNEDLALGKSTPRKPDLMMVREDRTGRTMVITREEWDAWRKQQEKKRASAREDHGLDRALEQIERLPLGRPATS